MTWTQVRGVVNGLILMVALTGGMFMGEDEKKHGKKQL
jgi:hypothetical protein